MNPRSIKNNFKFDELRAIVKDNGIYIIGIVETWFNSDVGIGEYQLEGYSMYRRDRNREGKMRAGGVALYIHNSIVSKECTRFNNLSCEGVICEVGDINREGIYVAVFYRAPTSMDVEVSDLFSCIRTISNKHSLIMGDFNYPGIDWDLGYSDGHGACFFNLIQDCFLYQSVRVPTRRENILDLVLCTEEGMVGEVSVKEPLGTGDHAMVFFKLYGYGKETIDQLGRVGLNYSKANYRLINEHLNKISWGGVFEGLDSNQMWEKFMYYIKECVNKFVPEFKPKSRNGEYKAWYCKRIDKFRKKKSKCWEKFRRSDLPEDEANYKIALNQYTNEIRKAKTNFEVELAQGAKLDSKPFFQYIRKNSKIKQGIGKLVGREGQIGEDDSSKAEILSQHFSSVFNCNRYDVKPEVDYVVGDRELLQGVDVDMEFLRDKIKSLKVTKAAGYDNLPAKLLVNTCSSIISPLKLIFDSSLSDGIVPFDWKKSNVTPIFKSGERASPNNYRPVSLTCISCKILETFVRDALVNYLTENNIIYNNQHGFIKGKSCMTNLLTFLEYVEEAVDCGYPVDVVYLDFSKAFDSVPHELLIHKLGCYGIRGKLLIWIRDWLCGREQRVVINGSVSSWQDVRSGVPQGSVLGPVLFAIYINDLGENLLSRLLKFADDTKTFRKVCNIYDAEMLQRDLDSLSKWGDNWGMKFNAEKCKVMHFGGTRNLEFNYSIGDQVLEVVESEKDLGVIVSKDLKVTQQCCKAASMANRMLGMVKRTFTSRKREVILPLFKSIIRPHLEYCIQSWQPHLSKDVELLEAVQHRATKCIEGMSGLSYDERLRELMLPSLRFRRIRGDLLEMFKMYKGWSGLRFEDFFELNKTNSWLRGHEAKIFKKRFNTNIGKFSFCNRSVDEWNRLPSHLLFCETLNRFKNKLDIVLRDDWGYI